MLNIINYEKEAEVVLFKARAQMARDAYVYILRAGGIRRVLAGE